jgi:hypothetical protein
MISDGWMRVGWDKGDICHDEMKLYHFGNDPFDARTRRLKKFQFFPLLLIGVFQSV